MDEKYEIIAFDAQYFLVRNFMALKGRSKVNSIQALSPEEGDPNCGYVIDTYEFTEMDLVKQFTWTICKLVRDYFPCNKIILLWDKSPYHKLSELPDYKDSREYVTEEDLDEWDIENDAENYLQAKEEIRINYIKNKAKYWIVNNFHHIGMPSVIQSGWEADDLAYLFSQCVKDSDKRFAICSSDSDWMFWIDKNVDFISFNKKEVWNYEDVSLEFLEYDKMFNMSLFELKTQLDSLFMSHNDLKSSTTMTLRDFPKVMENIQKGDLSDVEDIERYEANVRSFDILNYPDNEEMRARLLDLINNPIEWDMSGYDNLKDKGFLVTKKYIQNHYNQIMNNLN